MALCSALWILNSSFELEGLSFPLVMAHFATERPILFNFALKKRIFLTEIILFKKLEMNKNFMSEPDICIFSKILVLLPAYENFRLQRITFIFCIFFFTVPLLVHTSGACISKITLNVLWVSCELYWCLLHEIKATSININLFQTILVFVIAYLSGLLFSYIFSILRNCIA